MSFNLANIRAKHEQQATQEPIANHSPLLGISKSEGLGSRQQVADAQAKAANSSRLSGNESQRSPRQVINGVITNDNPEPAVTDNTDAPTGPRLESQVPTELRGTHVSPLLRSTANRLSTDARDTSGADTATPEDNDQIRATQRQLPSQPVSESLTRKEALLDETPVANPLNPLKPRANPLGFVSGVSPVSNESNRLPDTSGNDIANEPDSEAIQSGQSQGLEEPKEPKAPKALDVLNSDITLDPSQIHAVNGILTNTHSCLIGYAGTGKSTVVDYVIAKILQDPDAKQIPLSSARFGEGVPSTPVPSITGVAYTGRASTQLKNKMHADLQKCVSTIHAMLAYAPEYEERLQADGSWKDVKIFKPRFTANHKLPWSWIFIDEAGMVPADLWNKIIAALPANVRLVLVGDIAQLPPIHGYSPLPLAMTKWPTFELTTIHRQKGSDNTIPFNAQNIRTGKMPEWNKSDFLFQDLPRQHLTARSKLIAVVKQLTKAGQFDPHTDAIISAQNVGHLGQEAINFELMSFFNPKPRVNVEGGMASILAAEGDKVMATKNDLDLGITNGMLGYITDIKPNPKYKANVKLSEAVDIDLMDFDNLQGGLKELDTSETEREEAARAEKSLTQRAASHIVVVEFENGVTKTLATAGDMANLCHAYAFTCHKSQGGEYRQVIVLTHSAHGQMLNREWFYTAITRAQKRVIVVGDMKGLNGALKNQAIKGKTLKEKAESILAYCQRKVRNGEEHMLPILPESKPCEAYSLLEGPSAPAAPEHLEAEHQANSFFNKLIGMG